MIAHSLRTIFIHIPKTAGSSIEVALNSVEGTNEGAFDPATQTFNPVTTGEEKHLSAIECRKFYGDEIWNTYFKFTVVRNPWERFHSVWWNSKEINKKHSLSFPDYTKKILRPPLHKRLAARFLRRFSPPSSLRPQADWLRSASGKLELDYICRFESIATDFRVLCGKIGLPEQELPKVLVKNRSPATRNHYSLDYDEETTELVAQFYRDDIDLFEYTFEPGIER